MRSGSRPTLTRHRRSASRFRKNEDKKRRDPSARQGRKMVSDDELTAAAEWRRYWSLALAGLTGFSFMSFMVPATGVFMGPLSDEFGWNRTQLSSGQAVSAFLPLFLVPLIGVMIDKWGT